MFLHLCSKIKGRIVCLGIEGGRVILSVSANNNCEVGELTPSIEASSLSPKVIFLFFSLFERIMLCSL